MEAMGTEDREGGSGSAGERRGERSERRLLPSVSAASASLREKREEARGVLRTVSSVTANSSERGPLVGQRGVGLPAKGPHDQGRDARRETMRERRER